MANTVPAPGARIIVRDAQWLVRKVERTQGNGHIVHAIGLSELVRDKEAQFLTRADSIEVMDPAETAIVQDSSPNFRSSLLYMESLLRKTLPTDDRIYCGHKAAMDSVPYQLDPAALALKQPRQRILIADAVGLGKTLECGLLLSELIRRGKGRRILVVTVKSMLTQFQKEMWSRFSIPLTRLDSVGLNRIRTTIPTNHNPFHYFDKSIISVDTLKQDTEYRVYLENAWWDAIVIDEAHNVAERGKAKSQRARLAKLLASRSDSLIMLSATPHDGSAQSFASLMNMLDPTAIANTDKYGPEDIRGLFIRRFKKDIKHQVRSEFKERVIQSVKSAASSAEEAAFESLANATFAKLGTKRGAIQLFRTVLEKALFSSPAACAKTIENRIRKLEAACGIDSLADIDELKTIHKAVSAVNEQNFSKFQRLVQMLTDKNGHFHFTGKAFDDRLVIFTERIETLEFLYKHLPKVLQLTDKQVTTLRGDDPDTKQQEVVEEFGKDQSPLRLLIATDVASEGINLHYLCHKMVHFDVPWSLMAFQQRNGRIDRYGQTRTPYIAYLMTDCHTPKIKGDVRILELLIQKDEEAIQNIGDPSAFMGVYDIGEEERITAEAMEAGKTAEEFEQSLQQPKVEDDIFAMLTAAVTPSTPSKAYPQPLIGTMPSLFASDFEYACEALKLLNMDASVNMQDRSIEIPLTDELKYRFRHYPSEVMSGRKSFVLCDDKNIIQQEIARSRKEENAWPHIQYLWEQDPLVQWISDKAISNFRRLEAPVLPLSRLSKDEAIFLVSGLIPNRKGHPIVQNWFGCHTQTGSFKGFLSLEDVMGRTKLGIEKLANTGTVVKTEPLQKLLPDIIAQAKRYLHDQRSEFEKRINPLLQEQLQRLSSLHNAHLGQYLLDDTLPQVTKNKNEVRRRETNKLFDEYKAWIKDTLETEDSPYIKIIAVLTAGGE